MAILLSILMALGLVGGSNVNNQTGIDANDTNNHSTTKPTPVGTGLITNNPTLIKTKQQGVLILICC